jgi:integrase
MFLTGCRVSEIVGIKRNRDGRSKPFRIYKSGDWMSKPLTIGQVKLIERKDGIKFIRFENLPVLKKKLGTRINMDFKEVSSTMYRDVMLPYNTEEFFIKQLYRYLKTIDTSNPDRVIFPFSRVMAWKIIYTLGFGNVYPHFFRHVRATDLARTYGLDGTSASRFFEWKSSAQFDRYSHVSADVVFKLMLQKVKK